MLIKYYNCKNVTAAPSLGLMITVTDATSPAMTRMRKPLEPILAVMP